MLEHERSFNRDYRDQMQHQSSVGGSRFGTGYPGMEAEVQERYSGYALPLQGRRNQEASAGKGIIIPGQQQRSA